MLRDLGEVATRAKFHGIITPEAIAELIEFIETHALFITPRHPVKICRDPDDDHLLSLGVESGASVLVSNDKDLTSLGSSYAGVKIMTSREFLDRFLA